MLSKKNRLQKNSSFIATYHQNRVVSDEFFVLYAGKNKTEGYDTKFGFIVSKKVHKRAVVRNKIKRHLREAVKLYIKENDCAFMSVILKAKPASIEADFQTSLKSVNKLLSKLAIKFI